TASPVEIVATGANMVVIGDVAAIDVESGASLNVRNLTGTSERQIQCGIASNSAPFSSIQLRDSALTMVGNGGGFELQRVELELRNVDVHTTVDLLVSRDDSTFKADGLYVHGSPADANSILMVGRRMTIDVVNAVFEDIEMTVLLNDTGPPATSIRFAYSTF